MSPAKTKRWLNNKKNRKEKNEMPEDENTGFLRGFFNSVRFSYDLCEKEMIY